MGIPGSRHAKRIVLEVVGWTLVVAGIAALVLPGPGLLLLFAGLAVLSQQYDWADRRMVPVRERAVSAARQSVQTWRRIFASMVGVAWLFAAGVAVGVRPEAPSWWPLHDRWWLPGGWATGATLILSGAIALGMIVFSFRRYRD